MTAATQLPILGHKSQASFLSPTLWELVKPQGESITFPVRARGQFKCRYSRLVSMEERHHISNKVLYKIPMYIYQVRKLCLTKESTKLSQSLLQTVYSYLYSYMHIADCRVLILSN